MKSWKIVVTFILMIFAVSFTAQAEDGAIFNESITINVAPEPSGDENSYAWIGGFFEVNGTGETIIPNPEFEASAYLNHFSDSDLGVSNPNNYSVFGHLDGNSFIKGPGDLSLSVNLSGGVINSLFIDKQDMIISANSLTNIEANLQNTPAACNEIQELSISFVTEGNGNTWSSRYQDENTVVNNLGVELGNTTTLETGPDTAGTIITDTFHEISAASQSATANGNVVAIGEYMAQKSTECPNGTTSLTSKMEIMTQSTSNFNGGEYGAHIWINKPVPQP